MSDNPPAVVEVDAAAKLALASRRQADTDHHLVALWIGRHDSAATRRNYQRQADRFLGFVRRPLVEVRIGDLQATFPAWTGSPRPPART